MSGNPSGPILPSPSLEGTDLYFPVETVDHSSRVYGLLAVSGCVLL